MKQIKLIEREQVNTVLSIIKKILFITSILLTFILSDKLTNLVVATSYDNLNRVINVVLVVAVVIIFKKNKKVL